VSYATEVKADSTGTWAGNQLRFATHEEAEIYVKDLARRWTLVTDTRVVESTDPVNRRIEKVGERSYQMHIVEAAS